MSKQVTKGIVLSEKRSIINIPIKEFITDYIYRIDLDADYQREKIWGTKQQELLLDSIISDIDVPKIYLAEVKENKQFDYECIDGKQRMSTLLKYFKPDSTDEAPLMITVAGNKYNYKQLKQELPNLLKKLENYKLSFTIYKSMDEDLTREIFRRLQLGIRLNSGELLKTRTGTIRNFIYKEIGNEGLFFRKTKLSEKRFSRPFTLAQICLNSFARAKPDGDFVRARLQDIEYFFEENHDLDTDDENLNRIREVLKIMDKRFEEAASVISSRAIAVTGYLFVEEKFLNQEISLIETFSKFYLKMLNEIKHNMDLLSNYEKPTNSKLMEEFQKYVLQASVEAYSIRRRHNFLKMAFDYYLNPKTKGKIVGSKR